MDRVFSGLIGSIVDNTYGDDGRLIGIVGLIIVLVVLRWAPRITDSVIQAFSGEQRSLMSRGFLRQSTRIRRTIELQAIVSRLAMIMRMNLPLCQALDAAAAGERGRIRVALHGLAQRIREGSPVAAALESVLPDCPIQLITVLRRAETCGQLALALDQQERMIDSVINVHFRSTSHTRHAMAYGLVMVLFCGVMILGVVTFLMPKFKDIFLDFDVRLPGITIALLNCADWLACNATGMGIILMVFCLLGLVVPVITRRMDKGSVRSRAIAWVRFRFPITHSLDHGLGMAKAIRAMSLEIRSGSPNAFAQSYSSMLSDTNSLRTRLDTFADATSRGVAPHVAAHDARLGDVFVGALRMVEHGDSPERVLAHAADYYETLAYRWWHALAAISGPLMTLAMGVLVGFVALALFMPLIALIDSVAETY